MPELPEVETVAKQLHKGLVGFSFSKIRILRGDVVTPHPDALLGLEGLIIQDVGRYGKQLFIHFERQKSLRVQLRMTGRFYWTAVDANPSGHTHVIFHISGNGHALHYSDIRRFGRIHVGSVGQIVSHLAELGHDAWALELPALAELLNRRRQIKALLMDQRSISGLGNIYTDEILWRARLHPRSQADNLQPDERRRLFRALRRILREAIEAGGSTVSNYRPPSGVAGGYQTFHRVYRKTGLPCRRCRALIRRAIMAGRSTHYCPHCQRLH